MGADISIRDFLIHKASDVKVVRFTLARTKGSADAVRQY